MKMISKIAIVFLLGIVNVFAASPPPTPASTAKSTNSLVGPPDPELPIDSNLLFLVIAAVLLGIYVIYKYNHRLNTKASM